MVVKKGMTKAQVELAGKKYDLRYDVDSIGEVEITAQAVSLNSGRNNYYDLLDAPYNFREQVCLILAGINGAKRYDGLTDFLDQNSTKKLMQEHFDWVRSKQFSIRDWQESIRRLNNQISEAARLGVGLVPPSMIEEKKEETTP